MESNKDPVIVPISYTPHVIDPKRLKSDGQYVPDKNVDLIKINNREYVIYDEPLGKGAAGVVFAAQDKQTGEWIALKKFNLNLSAEALQEFTAQKIKFENTIKALQDKFDSRKKIHDILEKNKNDEVAMAELANIKTELLERQKKINDMKTELEKVIAEKEKHLRAIENELLKPKKAEIDVEHGTLAKLKIALGPVTQQVADEKYKTHEFQIPMKLAKGVPHQNQLGLKYLTKDQVENYLDPYHIE